MGQLTPQHPDYEPRIEQMCRRVCEVKKINPDGDGYGMGHTMPLDTRYKLWEAQRPAVEAVLSELNYWE